MFMVCVLAHVCGPVKRLGAPMGRTFDAVVTLNQCVIRRALDAWEVGQHTEEGFVAKASFDRVAGIVADQRGMDEVE